MERGSGMLARSRAFTFEKVNSRNGSDMAPVSQQKKCDKP